MKEYLGINLGGEGLYKQNRKAVKKEIKEKIRKRKKNLSCSWAGPDQHCKDIYTDKVKYRLGARDIMILHLKPHCKAIVTKTAWYGTKPEL